MHNNAYLQGFFGNVRILKLSHNLSNNPHINNLNTYTIK